ncbi:MAG: hypothetical protein ACPKNR_13255 [Pleomorphochaeta sp.]
MTYKEVEKILTESKKEDWINWSSNDICVYKKDLNLRIERFKFDKGKSHEYKDEDLTNIFGKGNVFFDDYNVYYGQSPFIGKTFFRIDEPFCKGAILPFRKTETTCLKIDANMARIIDKYDETDEYIKKAGLSIIDC